MLTIKGRVLLSGLLLAGVLVGLSGCGSASSGGSSRLPTGKPDSVRIEIDTPSGPTQGKPIVTLVTVSKVQQLYTTIYALPQMPADQSCTLELGPHYTLTFRQAGTLLDTVIARREGCHPVSIAGEKQDRQATKEFWTQLDLAIYEATPPARPEQLSILRPLQPGQQPQTAQITSAIAAQRLYNAILALPLLPWGQGFLSGRPDYQFVFHAPDQAIASAIDKQRNLISLEGNFHTRGGWYTMNAQFKRLLEQTLASATFVTAHPDSASLNLMKGNSVSQQGELHDTKLFQKFYNKVLTLPSTQPPPNCPSGEDKVAGKGTLYYVSFTQWDLPILQVEVYEGSCKLIELTYTNQALQGDQAFWDLAHRVIGQ